MYTVKRHIRRSQAVTTFGPGAIVDLREESVMMAGLDFWPKAPIIEIHEPNLEQALGVDGFRMPVTVDLSKDGKDLPIVIFPRWMVCPTCHRLAPYDFFTAGLGSPGTYIRCPACKKRVYPARLIVACRHGHVDDFPWVEWLRRSGNPCLCEKPVLTLTSMGRTASLADLVVKCINANCNKYRTLSGATQPDKLKFMRCTGNRPWLNDHESCDEEVIPLQRGASNVYFSLVASSISIPPWSKSVHNLLNSYWSTLKYIPDVALKPTIEGMNLPLRIGLSSDDIVRAIIERRMGEKTEGTKLSEKQIRYSECLALRQPYVDAEVQDDFKTRPVSVPESLSGFISKVVLIERLREVRALLGFTRVSPPDPDPSSRFETTVAPISRRRENWLPAVEVHGEGIYIEFNEEAYQSWSNQQIVQARAEHLQSSYQQMCERRKWKTVRRISPRLLLTHSFAHALIRQLSLESGYSSAAVRERLYVFEPGEMENEAGIAGLLIYTSTPDSEGSLGGLVRQGLPERFSNTVKSAVNEAVWCSSDPLCIESDGQGHEGMNLAACHSCLLLSETCCEEFNRLLDRAMLIGTLTDQSAGFFSPLVEA